MYILSEREDMIVASEFVQRYAVKPWADAATVLASYGTDDRAKATLGRYANEREARAALLDLFDALRAGDEWFRMPASTYYDGAETKKDARTKRKGGS